MANYRAIATGLWSAGATWAGGAVPPNGAGHSIYSNTFTVTVDINVDVALVTNAANAGTFVGGGTAALGGTFPLNNGVTMTSPITASASANCVSFAGVSPNTATIVGTVTGGGGSTAVGVANNSSGTLLVTSAGTNTGRAFANNSSGTLTITGNCTATGGGGSTPLATNSAGGVVNIIGNVVGGSGGGSNGVNNTSNGAVNITGNVTGGSAAIGVNNTSTGLITIVGNVTAGATQLAVSSTTATVRISGSFIYAIDGFAPVYALRIILSTTPTLAKTRYALNGAGTYLDMYTADNTGLGPETNNVRSGVTYSGMTGTLAVPLPSQVAVNVPTDNTVGTAVLTPADVATFVWAAASRTITGGTVTTLTNSPNVPSPASIASQVRTELTSELAKVSALNTDRLAQCATTSIVGNLIAQSNS